MKRFIMKMAVALGICGMAHAHEPHPAIEARYICHTLKMDGKMSDSAWMQAVPVQLELPLKAYSKQPESIQSTLGAALREKGRAKLLWNDEYLYVGAIFEDSDIVADGKDDQTLHCNTGDLLEVFLKPETDTYYLKSVILQ